MTVASFEEIVTRDGEWTAMPQPVKDAIKPVLRSLRILPPDATPEFMKTRRRVGPDRAGTRGPCDRIRG